MGDIVLVISGLEVNNRLALRMWQFLQGTGRRLDGGSLPETPPGSRLRGNNGVSKRAGR